MKKTNKHWNPAQIGNIPDDWVKAYTVGIGNLPMIPNRAFKKWIEGLKKLEGFIGIRPEHPHGTLLLFATENNAKVARNIIKNDTPVGDNICECYIPQEYARKAEHDDNRLDTEAD